MYNRKLLILKDRVSTISTWSNLCLFGTIIRLVALVDGKKLLHKADFNPAGSDGPSSWVKIVPYPTIVLNFPKNGCHARKRLLVLVPRRRR